MRSNESWLPEPQLAELAPPPREDLRAGGRDAFVKLRLHSLDAYRGLIMVSLAFGGFGLAGTAINHLETDPNSPVWREVADQFGHVAWVGCNYWDLIQPSFMFMVGVAAAYSYNKRKRLGNSYGRLFLHAFWRSIVLVLLGIFLMSNWGGSTNWTFVNVLSQIGLAYTLLFFCWGWSFRTQFEIAIAILIGVWAAYFFYPDAGIDLQTGAPELGVTLEWAQQNLAGVDAHWHKNANVGHWVDVWLLNLVPRAEPFRYNSGGYQTINFLPSMVTMLFGLMAGEWLRSSRTGMRKLFGLLLVGVVGIAAGWLLDWSGVCPLVKRIWTPSWAVFSSGWCCLILAFFFATIDLIRFRYWAIPLIVVGMNSLAMYFMSMLLKPWVAHTLETHFGDQVFRLRARWGEHLYRFWFMDDSREAVLAIFEPTVRAVLIGLVLWLITVWMYRQRIFVRI